MEMAVHVQSRIAPSTTSPTRGLPEFPYAISSGFHQRDDLSMIACTRGVTSMPASCVRSTSTGPGATARATSSGVGTSVGHHD